MNDPVYNSYSLNSVAAALMEAMGIEKPECAAPANPAMKALLKNNGIEKVDRVVMYNPDAVALWLYQKYTEYYLPVQKHISLTLPLKVVMPSVTPVCFGTMYTGAMPEVHGIQSYTKPVIKTDSVFDALIRAGKKPAILATSEGCSMSKIYLEREMDYFFYPTIDEVNARALDLIEADEYDFIAIYNGNYDSKMHKNAPEGEESLAALRANCKVFDEIGETIKRCWKNHKTLLGFAPDHGCHEIDGGAGSHGLDMVEDLNILHFYGII